MRFWDSTTYGLKKKKKKALQVCCWFGMAEQVFFQKLSALSTLAKQMLERRKQPTVSSRALCKWGLPCYPRPAADYAECKFVRFLRRTCEL